MKNWSPYQNQIFSFVENGKGNAIIEAVAGSGKSTTIVEAMSRIPEDKSAIFLAFNKRIADELKSRGVNARTFHSIGMAAMKNRQTMVAPMLDQSKIYNIFKDFYDPKIRYEYLQPVRSLISLAKNLGVDCIIDHDKKTWEDIFERYNLILEEPTSSRDKAIALAMEIFDRSNKSAMYDFDDMLYLVVRENLNLQKYDFVFVDEAQDTNDVQRNILHRMCHKNTRLIAVGDHAQAIYGFRGANHDAMDLIADEFECERFPLSVSYRCGKNIVKYARTWVKHIEHSELAEDGIVMHKDEDWDYGMFANQSSAMVVCRMNRPLVEMAFNLIRNNIPSYIVGKEIGTTLKSLIKSLKPSGLRQLSEKLELWRESETKKAEEGGNMSKVAGINDRASTLQFLIDNVDNKTIDGLNQWIDMLFSDRANALPLSTIHKAKGLEADTVFWLNPNPNIKFAMSDNQRKQESNLKYVAATRAKSELITFEMGA